jgi:DNA polymerase-3 subunit alpha
MNSLYVPLRNFTKYTISESILDIKPWLVKLAQHKIPAAVCTDKNNLFSMVQFYKTAISLKIKPIFGVHFLVQVPGSSKRLDCLFLAKNNNGYIQLSSIISDYYKKTNADRSFDVSILKNQSSDLMLIVDQESIDLLGQQLSFWKSLFDNRIFIGLQRYPEHKESYAHSYQALRFCQEHAIVPVAANSVFFLNEEDFETQQIKVCIQNAEYYDDARRVIHHHKHQYFLNPEVMSTLFSDCLHVLKNTITLAEKCTVHLNFGQILLPQFSNDEQSMLFTLAQEGLLERKKMNTAIENDFNKYHDRLVFELKMICQMGFSGYFLIVSDFIRWAKNNLIPVGPGRGSGAGSLVAYVLKITDLDPLQYDLLFERFLNPERVSMPDFDVDFCMEKRDAVIQYVQKRYGIESVSQIATFGTMAAKAVIRDVGRVLNHPFPFVDKLAKMIPLQIGITLSDALEKNELLKKAYQDDEVVTQLIDYALKLEGLPRNIGKHAGGVVIAPRDLKTICPLYNEPDAHWHPITQLDKDDVESIGLIKFDFLGLKT